MLSPVEIARQAPFPVNPNFIINGSMQVSQRASTWSNPPTVFFIDRWLTRATGSVGGTLAIDHNTGQDDRYAKITFAGATGVWYMDTRIENLPGIVKADDSFTHVTCQFKSKTFDFAQDIRFDLYIWTPTDGVVSVDLTASGGRTVSVPATGNNNEVYSAVIELDRTAIEGLTIDADSYFQLRIQTTTTPDDGSIRITDVKMERGVVATPVNRPLMAETLALCQRYFQKPAFGNMVANLCNVSTTGARGVFNTIVTMRTIPSVAVTSPTSFTVVQGGSVINVATLGADQISADGMRLVVTVASGLTTGYAVQLLSGGVGEISLEAEL